jgi:hypothetical protein
MHVSLLLYDQVEAAGGLGIGEDKNKWRDTAAKEVDAALKRLSLDKQAKVKKEEISSDIKVEE